MALSKQQSTTNGKAGGGNTNNNGDIGAALFAALNARRMSIKNKNNPTPNPQTDSIYNSFSE